MCAHKRFLKKTAPFNSILSMQLIYTNFCSIESVYVDITIKKVVHSTLGYLDFSTNRVKLPPTIVLCTKADVNMHMCVNFQDNKMDSFNKWVFTVLKEAWDCLLVA